MPALLNQGYVVVATDYPGLGTDGIHPYLIGESEGRAVLNSVRAARDFPNSGASNRFAVWVTAKVVMPISFHELPARYAPDPRLLRRCRGSACNHSCRALRQRRKTRRGLACDGVALLDKARNVSAESVVEPAAMPAFNKTARDCLKSVAQFETIETDEKPLENEKFFKFDPSEVEPWKGIMVGNSPGHAPAGAPVFIAQGTADTTVNPQITKRFGEALCAQGVRVSFVELPGVSHVFAARDSAAAAIRWMNDRFRGAPAPWTANSFFPAHV